MALDIAGPFPTSNKGERYVLVVMDYFTRWAEAYPLRDQTAVSVADAFARNFIARWGPPRELHKDQGRDRILPSDSNL